MIEQGVSHRQEGCPYNHEAIEHFFICNCCKMEDGDVQLNGEMHSENVCSKKHGCCAWLIYIVATELDVLRCNGIDPMEYSQKNPNITKNFDHGMNGVRGPHWVEKWEKPRWQ